MRVTQFSCHIELEVSVVLNSRVTQSDVPRATFLENLLCKYRFDCWVHFLTHVFHHDWESVWNRILKVSQIVRVREL